MHTNSAFLQLLISSMTDPVYYADAQGVYQECNKAFEALLGRDRGAIIGRTVYDVWPQELADASRAKDQELLDHPGTQTYEGKVADASGARRDVTITKATYTDPRGKVTGIVGVIVGGAGRKDMELPQRLSRLGIVVHDIVHEINNPLMIISGRVQLSQMEDIRNEEIKNNLQIIMQECQRAKGIVAGLRQFSCPAKGDCRLVVINALAEEAAACLEKQFGPGTIIMKRTYAPDLPAIMVDERMMLEAFVHILDNARDAIEGQGLIEISTSRDGENIKITFRDSGKGMAPDVLEKVFVPFFTTRKNGAGLGLPVSYSIIKAHNGQLSLASTPGEGTTATILLPVTPPPA